MKKTALILWYEKYGRHDLPWRNTNSPYHIYLSEIMLQQTQVKTVLERFYFQFLDKFPTLEVLAKASVDDVLKAWEGLGYYTRARNLHKTAQQTRGTLPKTVEELELLSGIGPSTARAIACFAFGVHVPILDGNVKRILYRYFATISANDKVLWDLAHQLFESHKKFAYEYNQALMDIGSSICTIKNPQCEICPLEKNCLGKSSPLAYPLKKAKKTKELRVRSLVIYTHQNKIALFVNEQNLLKGLYSFKQYSDELNDSYRYLGDIKHEYSHIALRAKVYTKEVNQYDCPAWFDEEQVGNLALSKVDYKALELFSKKI